MVEARAWRRLAVVWVVGTLVALAAGALAACGLDADGQCGVGCGVDASSPFEAGVDANPGADGWGPRDAPVYFDSSSPTDGYVAPVDASDGAPVDAGATDSSGIPDSGDAGHGTVSFGSTGAEQDFVVPAGVTSLTIQAQGAAGGGTALAGTAGAGGSTTATIAVTPGETLAIFVGGQGTNGDAGCSGYTGGFNGGGAGTACGGGGGGASDVRQGGKGLGNRVVVAGGGGGADGGNGGAGGAATGAGGSDGTNPGTGGGGGTPTQGGTGGGTGGCGGANGANGSPGVGGDGGQGGGGGGGAGYFGGGGASGGAGTCGGGGGGGGSSYATPSATNVSMAQGGTTGSGQVVLSW